MKTILNVIFLTLLPAICHGGDWQYLFNGKDLSGWEVRGWAEKPGTAEFRVEDGMIVGVSAADVPNTFLCTEKPYGDFILEFEVLVDPGLNSGVQFRSNSRKDYQNGRVHGYQVEIDTSARAWSGGLYEEGRRGWLVPLTRNEKGQQAFRNGEWNHYRVEAVGTTLRTWINGVQCARLEDAGEASGFIGLQVHSINNADHIGKTVKWRNVRIITDNPENHMRAPDPDVPEISYLVNQLSAHEKRHGWRLLWDGKTTKGWRRANDDQFPPEGWVIRSGELIVLESGGGESRNGGDIVTEEEFSDFELELEFKISKGANSGIKYFVVEGLNKGVGSAIGLEFQILDDKEHPDAKLGVAGNRTLASLYDLITAENLSEADRKALRLNPPGAWNKARLVVRGGHVEHWINNIKAVEYDRWSQVYRNLVAKSKYSVFEGFGQAPSGHLLLQDHGNEVAFRSIKVREF